MTIVEIIDHFHGFSAIKGFIRTNKKRTLLWIVAFLAFILSAIIDNLTATIVLITILRKLLNSSEDRIWFAGRSEEHTSELQSRPHLVCRLLLEKKKKK